MRDMRERRRSLAIISILVVAWVSVLVPPAGAGERTLWESDTFSVSGRLAGTRLVLAHTNRTDYWLHFRCRFKSVEPSGENERHATNGDLVPGEIWSTAFRRQSRLPSTTRCRVSVDTSDTIVWTSEDFVVLAQSWTQPDGSPQTQLWFVNKTNTGLHMTCSWWIVVPSADTYPQVWSPDLDPFEYSSLGMGGVALDSVVEFVCSPFATGEPFPITVPPSLATLFDNGTFLVTEQAGFIGNPQYWFRFINRLDTAVNASCSWTVTRADGAGTTQSWQGYLNPFGIGAFASGSDQELTFSAMSCSVA